MKTIWNVLAFLAITNMLALILFGVWLMATGRVDRDRALAVRELVAIPIDVEVHAEAEAEAEAIRLEQAAEESSSLAGLPMGSEAQIDAVDDLAQLGQLRLRQMEEENRRDRKILDAYERQLTERERALAAEVSAFNAMKARHLEESGEASFATVVKLLESLPPRQAKDQILLMVSSDTPEEAVTILRAMRAGSRTEIIAQMKSEDEKKVASDLLEGLRAPSVSGGLQETSDAERTATAAPN